MMSTVAAFESAIRIKSMYTIKSWLKWNKKGENMEINCFYINRHLQYGLGIKFTAC